MLNENQPGHWITESPTWASSRFLSCALCGLAVPTLPMVSGWRLPVGDTPTCKEKKKVIMVLGDRTKPAFERHVPGQGSKW